MPQGFRTDTPRFPHLSAFAPPPIPRPLPPPSFIEQEAGLTVEAVQSAVTEMSQKCGFKLTEAKMVHSLYAVEEDPFRVPRGSDALTTVAHTHANTPAFAHVFKLLLTI